MLKHSVLVTRGLAQSGPRTFTLTQERGRALASTSWEAIHSGARDEGHDARTPLRTRGFSSDERDAKCTTSEIVRHKAQLTQAERAAGGAARARAEAKAVQYLRQQAKREMEAVEEAPEEVGTLRPPWEEPPPEFGLAAVAERSIREAMRKGAFENLTGKGKPLKLEEDHTSQFYSVDSGQAVVNKILKNANYRPASIELRDELAKALEVGRANLRLAASAALAADRRGGPAPASSTGSAALRDGRGPYERNAKDFDALNDLVKQCNGAVLADRESFGALYPLHSRKQISYREEVDSALADTAAAEEGGQQHRP